MPENKEEVFELTDVSFAYLSQYPALRNISMRVEAGECVAVLGANGSGKSTLLKVFDGLFFPTSGGVKAFGVPLSEASLDLNRSEFARYFRRRVGLVFQDADTQLFSPVVWEEVAFGPLQLDLAGDEVNKRVKETLSLIGIEHLGERSPHGLSEGEKRKVAMASVLSMGPDILMMDEPSAGLDPRSQVWLEDFLIELHKAGKTVIFATHDLELAENVSKRAVVLGEDHSVMYDGPAGSALGDWDLLLKANLVHMHPHKHGPVVHTHPHAHTD